MALTFCGKKSEVGASVSYGHISSFFLVMIHEVVDLRLFSDISFSTWIRYENYMYSLSLLQRK